MNRFMKFTMSMIAFLLIAMPGFAEEKTYRIEVFQVAAVAPFDTIYNTFVKDLEKNGLVKGKNLTINRTVIDFDVEKAGLWKKIGLLMRIKSEASRIAGTKPDLVLTIGTPATKYGKDAIISAGIPLVFTGVAVPQAAGCKSLTEAGPGFTGTTLYMNVKDALRIVKLAFPSVKTIGIVHSDDDNAIAHADMTKAEGPALGFTIVTKQIGKSESIKPAVKELMDKGVQIFIIPLDTYYGMRNNEPSKEIVEVTKPAKIPIVSFIHQKLHGAALYVGSEFTTMGSLPVQQVVKILKSGAKPDTLPILRQQDLTIMVDTKTLKDLGIQLPMEILQISKSVD